MTNKAINRATVLTDIRRRMMNFRVAKLPIKMDITILNMIIQFLYKDGNLKTRKALTNIDKLFKSLDLDIYEEKEIELTNRIWIIQKTTEAYLREGLVQPEYIVNYVKDDTECDKYKESILETLVNSKRQINYQESKTLLKQIDDRLGFGYTITLKHIVEELFSLIDETNVRSYKEIRDDFIRDIREYKPDFLVVNISSTLFDNDIKCLIEAQDALNDTIVIGNGDKVVNQYPKLGTKINKIDKINRVIISYFYKIGNKYLSRIIKRRRGRA